MIKRIFLYLVVCHILFLLPFWASAVVPTVSYSPATNTLTLGTAFSITPTNSGGAVTTGSFAPIYSFATVANPWDVTVDASGNVYTISQTGNRIYKITPTGTITTLTTAVNGPTGIAIDALGNIYVSNFGTGDVLKFDTSGALLATIGGFNQPYGICFDSSNNAYIADAADNKVYKITAGTTTLATYVSGLTAPYGTSVDASGNLFVSQYTLNNIVKITPGLVKTTFATGFSGPRQLGIDASGNLYVADYGNNAIKKITSAGVVSTVTTATGLNTPRSAQPDAVGSLYIADQGNGLIKKVAATGWVISGTLPAGLSFNTSTGVISGTPTATFSSTAYTVMAYNTTGKSNVTTITLSCSQTTLDWKGTTSSAWATTTNWQPNGTPNQYTAVRIGSNVTFTNQPTLSANTTVSTVTFGTSKTATLTIANGIKLTINDDLIVNTGGATPTIVGSNATSEVDMAPGSTLTINGASTLRLTSPLLFVLKSDVTGDASVDQIASTSIIGTAATSVRVERYLTGGSLTYRGYRLLSSPVWVGTDTHSNNVISLNYIISGSFVTGTDGTTGGFDKAGNPSLYVFRENLANPSYTTFTGSNYRGIKNINQSPAYSYLVDNDAGTFYIPVGNGFMFFFRGSRATGTPYNTGTSPVAATLTAIGSLNAGNITVKDWFTPTLSILSRTTGAAYTYSGYNLVGNPYASAIDWDTYQTTSLATGGIFGTNLNGTIWMLDPVTKNFGSYISGSGGVGSATFMSNVIQSGQSFFVVASAANPALVFTESAKTNSQNSGNTLLLGKPVNTSNNQFIRLQMGQDAATSDQTLIRFNNQATPVYNSSIDAAYRVGFGAVSLATRSSDKVDLSINTVPLPKLEAQTIPLNIGASADGVYQLSLRDVVAVPQLYDIWLMDKYTNDSLDMKQNKAYSFNIYKTDSASFGSNRLSLVIRQNPLYAYHLANFDAYAVSNSTAKQVQIVWQSKNEGNYTYFTVEHSVDNGKTFEVLGGATATGAGQYSLLDKSPVIGQNLYRLKQVDINGAISYSKIVGVSYSGLSNKVYINNLSVYPNPVSSNFNLAIDSKSIDNASYSITFMNSSGTVVKSVTAQQPSWQGSVSNLKPGVYMVNVVNSKTGTKVGETKFVKL